MKAEEARQLGTRVKALLVKGKIEEAYAILAPTLAARTPFPALGRIGETIATAPLPTVNAFLEQIASQKTMGGWVIIGSGLGEQLACDLPGAISRCRVFIEAADAWYGADILGERVPGPALVFDLQSALPLLEPWRDDPNPWVRRTVGVAVHFWTKRSRGQSKYAGQAQTLLDFLAPMFSEWDLDAVKGVGWGLKTLGRYYPELLTEWLNEQTGPHGKRHRALMMRKATTYLPEKRRFRMTKS
jgi:hypothetical protein